MLKIKLFPQGKKHQRSFKIVVAEARSKTNGNYVESIGYWYPFTKTIELNKEKLSTWQKNGAQLTVGVEKLISPEKFPNKKKPVTTAAAK